MKSTFISLAIFVIFFNVSHVLKSQENKLPDEETLNLIHDSILNEAEVLYYFELAAWVSIDSALYDPEIEKIIGGYIVYEIENGVKSIVFSENLEYVILEMDYEFGNQDYVFFSKEKRSVTEKEAHLVNIRDKIIDNIIREKYKVIQYENYTFNTVLLEKDFGYRFYLLTGTTLNWVVPFGNDYLFETDFEGDITKYKRIHQTLINFEIYTDEGHEVVSHMHSHLKSEPYITATDICTFRLYARLYDLDNFIVYSTFYGKYFMYILKSNTIIVMDKFD